ncbi:MAG: alanine racemase, partial [Oscillospiraceae bacterium]|nr:alanine racemase [Oscillospiraceae bacterium]
MMNCNHYHRTWAEISLDAVEQNIANLRAWIPAGCKLMCVIKADGYGHGAAALASFLQEKCDYFAVSVLEEALTLRAQGVIKPILLLCYTSPSQYDAVARAGLAQTICSLETARALSEAAQKHGKTLRIHIAVDTGMNRVGFADTDASVEDIRRIAALPGLACEGIFSHFARADERETEASLGQYRRFDAFLAKLEAAGLRIPLRHICNSAGTMQLPRHYDMVRVGIAMYGLYPSDETDRAVPLTPAMQWKTHVAQLKTVPAGQGISYGHTFVTTRPTRVATLPVGYADGYPRALSNCGQVIVRGKYAPILGRVCMDLCMVDV